MSAPAEVRIEVALVRSLTLSTTTQTLASGSPVVTATVIAVRTEVNASQLISRPRLRAYSGGVYISPAGAAGMPGRPRGAGPGAAGANPGGSGAGSASTIASSTSGGGTRATWAPRGETASSGRNGSRMA